MSSPAVGGRRATIAAIAFVFALAIVLSWPGFEALQADSYRLLYSGRWIAAHGLLHREVFALGAGGRSFADQQWLAELVAYGTWRLVGYGGLAFAFAAALASGFALLAALMRRRGASVPVAIACSVLALFGGLSLAFVRAQVLAVPLFVALLWLCLDDRDAGRPRARTLLVLPLLVLWANLHGSVLIGAALATAYFGWRAAASAVRRDRRAGCVYLALAAATALAPAATPYGVHVFAYYQHMVGNRAVALADIEWDPPAFPALSFFQFAVPLALAAGAALAASLRGRRVPVVLYAAVGGTAFAATSAMRNNLWLAIAAALLIAEASPALVPASKLRPGFVRTLSWAAAALALLGAGRFALRSAVAYQSGAPLRALTASANYAALHPCARVIGDNTSASALLWLDPAIAGRVAFDGELEAYPPSALLRWIAFQAASSPRWLAAAQGYQLLIGASSDQPRLVTRLGGLADSSVLARDAGGIAVLVRTQGECGTLAAARSGGATDA